jgi:hypothetical protein
MPVSRGGLISFLDADEDDGSFTLDAEQEDFVGYITEHVWNFCTATWPLKSTKSRDAMPIVWTQDKMRNEVRPFPHYEYLRDCILEPIFMAPRLDERGQPRKLRFIIPKPRQMFVTNGILAGCLWHVLTHEAAEWLVAKNKKDEAAKFIKERVRFMYRRLPAWLCGRSGPEARQGYRTVNPKPAGRFWVDQMESGITAVARTFGESGEAIGETAAGVLDEAIRINNLPAVYAALDAQAPIIIMISAPPERGQRIDPRSLAFFREMAEGLEPGSLVKTITGRSDLAVPEDDDEDDTLEDVSALEMAL